MIVHILYHGQAFCGQPGLPTNWPAGHRWVIPSDRKDATCVKCLSVLDESNLPSDTDVSFSAKDREYQEPKPKTQPVPDLPEGEVTPDNLEHEKYLNWAKTIAKALGQDVWLISLKAQPLRGPSIKYALQMEHDPYNGGIKVSPTGQMWYGEEYT